MAGIPIAMTFGRIDELPAKLRVGAASGGAWVQIVMGTDTARELAALIEGRRAPPPPEAAALSGDRSGTGTAAAAIVLGALFTTGLLVGALWPAAVPCLSGLP